MPERLVHRQSEATAVAPALPDFRPAAERATDDIAPSRATVQVTCGALTEEVAVAGMTVGDVRTLLAAPFSIAPRATALVNGQPVAARHQLATGESLEFVRPSGEKGASWNPKSASSATA